MSYILVTNDDGVDSPALLPLVHELARLGPVRVAVPAKERSWIGKAISRWDELAVTRVVREGIEILAVDGFPADCTNLAVHSLFGERPSLVVSGVNIGLNVGLGFFLSSGTIGAAMEGWIAGLPAIALSVGRVGEDRAWKKDAVENPHGQGSFSDGREAAWSLREAFSSVREENTASGRLIGAIPRGSRGR